MELWIRSQDKEDLVKAYNFRILNQSDIAINVKFNMSSLEYLVIGRYSTKERALEVLDEIQQLIKNQYIVECKPLISEEITAKLRKHFTDNYSGEFIMQPSSVEIHPINPNVVVYEMPKE